ncbi:MAG: 16S rRNA processing protein RimM [Clostridia bacterium]|nr:16S rRNA processing protein RimM [Clostridia bacterium]
MKKQFLEVGQIVSTQGLKGEMRVDPWCDGPEFVCMFDELYLENGDTIKITKSRVQKNVAIIKAEGIDTIEQADKMRRTVLYINRDDVELDDDVFFVQDILNCNVVDVDTKQSYGKITEVFKTGANDVYQVTDENGGNYLVPVIDDVVINTDIESGVIEIRPMKGIFDDED